MEKEVVRYGLISTSQIVVNAHLPASLDSKYSLNLNNSGILAT